MNPLDIPLYFYTGLYHVWWLLQALPWPAPAEWFGSMAIFIGLYPARLIIKMLLPEDKVARRYSKRSKHTPSNAEHQGASAIAANHLLH